MKENDDMAVSPVCDLKSERCAIGAKPLSQLALHTFQSRNFRQFIKNRFSAETAARSLSIDAAFNSPLDDGGLSRMRKSSVSL
jgi:hypothetical protein